MKRCCLLVAAALALSGCVGPAGGFAAQPPAAPESPVASASAEEHGPRLLTLPRVPPGSCPVTIPTGEFVPSPPGLREPPPAYEAEWHGSDALWTLIDRGGPVWARLPQDPDGFGQKTFWWSALWDPTAEPEPAVAVHGRRLDGPERFETTGRGTNARADFGVAMLIGVTIPAAGCWELTGEYRGEQLTYVAWVAG